MPAIALGSGNAENFANLTRRSKASRLLRPLSPIIRTYRSRLFVRTIIRALQMGWRHIDYDPRYGSEPLFSRAIHHCGLQRSDLFLTVRARHSALETGDARASLMSSLTTLRTDYIDLYFLPWPMRRYVEAFHSMLQLKAEGKIRALGLANAHPQHVQYLYDKIGIWPDAVQIELHPLNTKKEILSYYRERNIAVQSYSPLAVHDFRLFGYDILRKISQRHGKTPEQIILKWHLQQGLCPVVRSHNIKHLQDMLTLEDSPALTPQEMDIIDGFNIHSCYWYCPDNHPDTREYDY